MGRHTRFLYQGRRGFLIKKLSKEICSKSVADNKDNLQIKVHTKLESNSESADIGIEENVLYGPSNLPEEVISIYGLLEIKPSILREYINELYKHK